MFIVHLSVHPVIVTELYIGCVTLWKSVITSAPCFQYVCIVLAHLCCEVCCVARQRESQVCDP